MSITTYTKQRTKKFIDSKHMLTGITTASFLESTIVPIPLEAILVPLMQARRERLWVIALLATIGCLLGALLGYVIGYYLFDLIGEWIINTLSSPQQFEMIEQKMQAQGFWFVISLGIVPLPFQIAMLAAGATKFSLAIFLMASAIARSIRYFGLAVIVYYAGNKAEAIITKHKTQTIIGLTIIILMLWGLSFLL